MSFNPILQLNIRNFFNRIGTFELLQFDISSFDGNVSLPALLPKMKELRFFESSFAYSKFSDTDTPPEEDEFGNYAFQKITWDDYKLIPFHELILKLSFEDKGDQFWLSLKEIDDIMSQNINQYIFPTELLYELNIPAGQKDKLASYCYWDNFKNFIGIDSQKKIIHLVTTGTD